MTVCCVVLSSLSRSEGGAVKGAISTPLLSVVSIRLLSLPLRDH